MNETELYKELGNLTKERDKWKESIPYVSSLLTHDSVRIKAKALWLLGEIGLAYPLSVREAVPVIALPITKSVEKDLKMNRFVEAHKTYDLQNQRRAVNENQLLSAKPYCLDKLEFVDIKASVFHSRFHKRSY